MSPPFGFGSNGRNNQTVSPLARGRIPNGIRIYAVGDIHGRLDLLERLLARIEEDICLRPSRRPIIVLLGDYIDRGPCSREVLDLLSCLNQRRETVCLRGNHEYYLCEFLKRPSSLSDWLRIGGLETLRSYGLAPQKHLEILERELLALSLKVALSETGHLQFLDSLSLSFVCGDYFFVHAGVRPGIPLDQQRDRDLLEIRGDFLNCRSNFEKIIVHGHTPVTEPEARPNRINLDTGAFATGKLTCGVFEEDGFELIQVQPHGHSTIDIEAWRRTQSGAR